MEKPKMAGKTVMVWLVLGFAAVMAWQFLGHAKGPKEIPYSAFMASVESGETPVVTIREDGHELVGGKKDGTAVMTHYTGQENIAELLRGKKAAVTVVPASDGGIGAMLLGWMPILLMVLLFVLMLRGMARSQMGGVQKFTASRAKLVPDDRKATFADVIGLDEQIEEVREIIDFLKDPKGFLAAGLRIPKGVLMLGPPGCGKTLLARAVAGEAGVPFFSISGSDFVEMFVGVGAARVRDLFETGKKHAPCIIFIDEIDAVGRHRGAGLGGGHDEREQTLNQLLVELDGFEASGAILIAATNRPDVLDPALTRPGRFDKSVFVPRPTLKGRQDVLRHYAKGKRLGDDVRLDAIAALTPGASPADLENLLNEAGLTARRRKRDRVLMADVKEAYKKIALGPERTTFIMSEEEKRRIARHESGHAVMVLESRTSSLEDVSIIPRGPSLGSTWAIPHGEGAIKTEAEMDGEIMVLLGGYAAERHFYDGMVSTGASDDLKRATDLERDMVCRYGMSDELGPVSYARDAGQIFLGRELSERPAHSEATEREIDLLVRKRLKDRLSRVERKLKDGERRLAALSEALYSRETLTRAEVDAILAEAAEDA